MREAITNTNTYTKYDNEQKCSFKYISDQLKCTSNAVVKLCIRNIRIAYQILGLYNWKRVCMYGMVCTNEISLELMLHTKMSQTWQNYASKLIDEISIMPIASD